MVSFCRYCRIASVHRPVLLAAVLLALPFTSEIPGQTASAQNGDTRPQSPCEQPLAKQPPELATVMDNLAGPVAVAIEPSSQRPVVAEATAGRIVRVVDGKPMPMVTGFASQHTPQQDVASLGLVDIAFLDAGRLVVAAMEPGPGEEGARKQRFESRLFVFDVPDDAAKPVDRGEDGPSRYLATPLTTNESEHVTAVTACPISVFAALAPLRESQPEDSFGPHPRIFRRIVSGTKFLDSKPLAGGHRQRVYAPVAMTMSPRGEVVVAHQQGDEASVVFHHVRSGKPLLWLRVPLRDVRDIAYHPSSGALYALDAAGVHRVDSLIKDGDLTAVAQKLVALKSGKSIAIAKDGTLYMVAGNKILSARP